MPVRSNAPPPQGHVEDLEVLRQQAVADADALRAELDRARAEEQELRAEISRLHGELDGTRQLLGRAAVQLGHAYRSLSWRATWPLRRLTERWPSLGRLDRAVLVPYWAATSQLERRLEERRAVEAAVATGQVDPDSYLAQHPEVAMAGLDPVAHYLAHRAAPAVKVAPPAPPAATSTAAGAAVASDPAVALLSSPPASDPGHILVVDYKVPTPDQDSGSVRMAALLGILVELGFSVTFASETASPQPSAEAPVRSLGIEIVYGEAALLDHLRACGPRYGWVLLSRPSIADPCLGMVRRHAVFAQVIYDTVDLHWVRLERAARLLGDAALAESARAARTAETVAITCSDVVFAISDADRRAILAEWPEVRVAVVPNVHRTALLPRRWAERTGLLFIGAFAHPPNADGVAWFTAEVLPLVLQAIPDARFKVIGSNLPAEPLAHASPALDLVGYVADPEPWFDEARVFVAPLRFGSGMKGKVGQAMSLGLPVVTTTIGAEGMHLQDGVHAVIADDARAFADGVIRVYRDEALWTRLREAAALHVDQNFSPAVARKALQDVFAQPAGSAT